jgi:hypothetical protein
MPIILPRAERGPSFSSSLGASLGSGLSQGLASASDFGKQMALQNQKSESKQSFLGNLFGSKNEKEASPEEDFTLSPDQETILALQDPTAFNAYKHLKESRLKEKEELQKKENLATTLDEMTNTLLGGKLGYSPGRFLTKQGRRDAQYFDSLNTQLESIGKDLVSKGVLSAPRFAFLLANLPSSDKSDAANAGAIEAWGKELGIPVSEDLKKLYKTQSSKPKKTKTGKIKFDISNPEHKAKRDQLLKKFNGDREEVMKHLSREFEE